ncbi:MAG: hypothetical protein ACK5AZ_13190 [Bryobacteraceae bacterium]
MARHSDETTIFTRQFFTFVAIGLAIASALVGLMLVGTKSAHLRLEGAIQSVRIQPTDENSAVAIFDFRITNPSDVPFVVRHVDVFVVDEDGNRTEGMRVAEVDANRIFTYYPTLGPKYNASLVMRDQISPHQTIDRMAASSFPLSGERLAQRKRFVIRIEDVDGAVAEVAESR